MRGHGLKESARFNRADLLFHRLISIGYGQARQEIFLFRSALCTLLQAYVSVS